MAKKDVFAPVDTDHPAFRSWFGKSVLHDNGVPRTYYHGTSKDADFKKFKMSRHGVWLTADPEEASKYAADNDSQGFRRDGWDMKRVNTASRVIPVHARIEKPFVGEMPKEYLQENYKKSQSDWFDALRSNGYDGWVPKSQNGKLAVALAHPGQIKSALSNTGDYSETGDINKAEGGSVKDYIPHDDPRRARNLKKFHGKTPDAIKNTRWYHGTNQNFQAFQRGKSGAIFVSPDPEFASFFATDEDRDYGEPNVMPVHVRAEKPFDYENVKHLNALAEALGPQLINDPRLMDTFNQVREGFWGAIEDRTIQKGIRSLGHDSFFVKERDESGEPSKNLAVYDPSQLKSATGNNGNFAREEDDITKAAGGSVDDQPQRDLSPLGLYSHAAEMASQLPQERGSPQQMAGMLVNKYGVKPVEMEGFDEAFAGQPTVTRDQLVQHFKSKMPQIEEKVLGVQPQGVPYPEEYQKIEQSIIDKYSPEMARHHAIYNDRSNDQSVRNEAFQNVEKLRDQMWSEIDQAIPNREELLEKANPRTTPTKFEKYTLPGGENYREVLLKLPAGFGAPKKALDDLAAATDKYKDLEKRHNDELEARLTGETSMSYEDFLKLTRDKDVAKARVKNFEKIVNQPIFQSRHWEDPDVVAHVRLSDRADPDGKKILHVEEIQSDWAQKGRDEGFRGQASSEYNKYVADMRQRMRDDILKTANEQNMPQSVTEKLVSNVDDLEDWKLAKYLNEEKQLDELRVKYLEDMKRVPSAPYVTKTADWTDLALKRALKEAVDGGYDKLVWTPGEEQANRYDLSKHLDRLVLLERDGQGHLIGYKDGNDIISEPLDDPAKELPEIIGKELTQRLMGQEPQWSKNKTTARRELMETNLVVGGEGMKGYYDKIVPTQLQKLLKKLDPDVKIGRTNINNGDVSRYDLVQRGGGWRVIDRETPRGDYVGPVFRSGSEAENWLAGQGLTSKEVHSIDITPKMREAVKRGLPAFASGGAVDEDENEGITAYHGSPYDFPKFDISKIGTGEGAQSYGHGLYFAESEPVAKSYRNRVTNQQANNPDFYEGMEFPPSLSPAELNELSALGMKMRQEGNLPSHEMARWKQIKNIKDQYENAVEAAKPKGHMYEVRIKAHPDHFLDWDKPLREQPEAIRNVFSSLGTPERLAQVRGEDAYRALGETLGSLDWPIDANADTRAQFRRSAAQRVSQYLSDNGIKGIKYLDAGSRDAGKGSRNYVVFNHDHVDIKRKYAQGGAIDVG